MPANLDITAGITALVLLLTQMVKILIIDPYVLKADATGHDALVRLIAYLLSVGLTWLAFGTPTSGLAVLILLITAIGPSGVSIAGYHVLTNSSTTTGLLQRQSAVGSALSTQPVNVSRNTTTTVDPLAARVAPPADVAAGGGIVAYTQGAPSGWLPAASGSDQHIYTPPPVVPAVAPEPPQRP